MAELSEKYLHKGDKVYIEGRLKTRSWEDKDNVKRYTTEIVAENMTMLSGKRAEDTPVPDDQEQNAPASIPDLGKPVDDLPF